jgi:hypothetical protein
VTRNPLRWQTIARAIGRALTPRPSTRRPAAPVAGQQYPGDFRGPFSITYSPHPDQMADPGEVVWTWVPYEEDHSRGKDRPVVVVGRDDRWLLAVPMTSKDHDRDAAQEAREDRYWVDIGSGDWDSSGRPSEVRVNRVLRVDPHQVRRLAGKLDKPRFDEVAGAIQQHFG